MNAVVSQWGAICQGDMLIEKSILDILIKSGWDIVGVAYQWYMIEPYLSFMSMTGDVYIFHHLITLYLSC